MDWEEFHEAHHRPHLVVGELGSGTRLESDTDRVALLRHLATKLDIVGNYSIREEGKTIQAAFELHVEAKLFGDLLLASPGPASVDWSSQSRFRLNRNVQQKIVKALRSSRLRMAKRPPANR